MRDKDFSDIVSERFKDYGSSPSNAVWENIESNLDQDKKRRRIIIWWSLAAVLALSIITLNLVSDGKEDSLTSSNSTQTKSKKSNKPEQSEKNQNSTTIGPDSKKDSEKTNNDSSTNNTELSDKQLNKNKLEEIKKVLQEYRGFDNNNPTFNDQTKDKEEKTLAAETDWPDTKTTESLLILPPKMMLLAELDKAIIHRENDISSFMQILPQRWSIGVKGSLFVNASDPRNGPLPEENTLISSYNDPDPEVSDYNLISHRRSFETELYIQYDISNKFKVHGGISYARGYDAQRLDTVIYETRRNTFGAPLGVKFSLLNKGKFQLTTDLSMINEFARVTTSIGIPDETAPPIPADQSTGIASMVYQETEKFTGNNYAFGLQGSIGASYAIAPRVKLTASIGYRNYLIERYSLNYQYVQNPNYFNGSIGVRWILNSSRF